MHSSTTEDIKTMPSQANGDVIEALVESIPIDQADARYGLNLKSNKAFLQRKKFILYDIESGNHLLFKLNDQNNIDVYRFIKLFLSKTEQKIQLYKKRMKQFKLWKTSNN